jgi:hypothetical protein
LEEQSSEHESFINRKRPAMEGLVEHIIGPTTHLDPVLGGKPVFPEQENEFEPSIQELKRQEKSKN